MRLLNVNTLQFKEVSDREIPPYGILSHRWTDDELSYKDFQKGRRTGSLGHQKVLEFCAFVRSRAIFQFGPFVYELEEAFERIEKGYQSQAGVETEGEALQWVWIDTICTRIALKNTPRPSNQCTIGTRRRRNATCT